MAMWWEDVTAKCVCSSRGQCSYCTEGPTRTQCETLKTYNVPLDDVNTKGEAAAIIEIIANNDWRRPENIQTGKPSEDKLKTLASYGLFPESARQASAWLIQIKSNGWKIPENLKKFAREQKEK